MRFAVIVLITVVLGFALQGPLPIPPCEGPECIDDVTHEDHKGAPAFCQNYDSKAWLKNCDCKRECDEDVGSGCVTYCRRKKCACDHGCDSK